MKVTVQSGKDEIEKLKGDDIIVVWGGGSNDINKQNSHVALRQLSTFVSKNQKVNVIVMTPPLRHDLRTSCVNSEVIRFNRLLSHQLDLHWTSTLPG
jgi:RNase H-fold protein (predicted Holliday junction resolvase)